MLRVVASSFLKLLQQYPRALLEPMYFRKLARQKKTNWTKPASSPYFILWRLIGTTNLCCSQTYISWKFGEPFPYEMKMKYLNEPKQGAMNLKRTRHLHLYESIFPNFFFNNIIFSREAEIWFRTSKSYDLDFLGSYKKRAEGALMFTSPIYILCILGAFSDHILPKRLMDIGFRRY